MIRPRDAVHACMLADRQAFLSVILLLKGGERDLAEARILARRAVAYSAAADPVVLDHLNDEERERIERKVPQLGGFPGDEGEG